MSSGTEKRARTANLTIRFTPEERAAVDEAAVRAGLTAGSHARAVLLGAPAPRQVRRPTVERRELARLLGQLGHVGGNLNQLAKAANSGAIPCAKDIQEALAGLTDLRREILLALGREP